MHDWKAINLFETGIIPRYI